MIIANTPKITAIQHIPRNRSANNQNITPANNRKFSTTSIINITPVTKPQNTYNLRYLSSISIASSAPSARSAIYPAARISSSHSFCGLESFPSC